MTVNPHVYLLERKYNDISLEEHSFHRTKSVFKSKSFKTVFYILATCCSHAVCYTENWIPSGYATYAAALGKKFSQ